MSDIENYIDSGRNINTKKKTEQCIGPFRAYLNQQFVLLEPEYLERHELNQLLCRFIMQLKRKDGTEYEPVTVRNLVGSIARGSYLNEKKYDVDIVEHHDFRDLREVLKRKLKELKELGLGKSCSGRAEEEDWKLETVTCSAPE